MVMFVEVYETFLDASEHGNIHGDGRGVAVRMGTRVVVVGRSEMPTSRCSTLVQKTVFRFVRRHAKARSSLTSPRLVNRHMG